VAVQMAPFRIISIDEEHYPVGQAVLLSPISMNCIASHKDNSTYDNDC
jgi:hypothetical protein